MSVGNLEELKIHRGHKIVIAVYGQDESVCVECETCHEVLYEEVPDERP